LPAPAIGVTLARGALATPYDGRIASHAGALPGAGHVPDPDRLHRGTAFHTVLDGLFSAVLGWRHGRRGQQTRPSAACCSIAVRGRCPRHTARWPMPGFFPNGATPAHLWLDGRLIPWQDATLHMTAMRA